MIGAVNPPLRSLKAACGRRRLRAPRSPPPRSAPWEARQLMANKVLPRAICPGSPGGRFCPGTNAPLRTGSLGGETFCVPGVWVPGDGAADGAWAVCVAAAAAEERMRISRHVLATDGLARMINPHCRYRACARSSTRILRGSTRACVAVIASVVMIRDTWASRLRLADAHCQDNTRPLTAASNTRLC